MLCKSAHARSCVYTLFKVPFTKRPNYTRLSPNISQLTHKHTMSEKTPQKAHNVGYRDVAATPWLKLQHVDYINEKGEKRVWDRVIRSTTTSVGIDAASVITILKSSKEDPKIVLIRQYRPALGAYTIEFPAGLIDEGEDVKVCASRELKEETGYTGIVRFVSPKLILSPGISTESTALVHMDVDLDDPVNHNPVQSLDESEAIEVICVKVKDLQKELDAFHAKGDLIFDGLYFTAVGLGGLNLT